ncbi:MAG: LacI family transcriptional regulator [Alphaproteobacteria bacterium]|nr:MAG: LacI family transcriptional regulator [Alphaproteobacteria bacterium]
MSNIQDVAKLSGVSVATVSRTLNNPEVVSEKTRKKVLKVVEEINYYPDSLAKNFRTRKTYMIVVLVPDIANPFFSRVIRGIQNTAHLNNYSILLGDTQSQISIEESYAKMVIAKQADGIIQLSAHFPLKDEMLKRYSHEKLPIVNICECLDGDIVPTIQLDNIGAAKTMTSHLIELGHKHIGVVTGPAKSPLTKDRLAGYRLALEEAGLSFDDNLIRTGDFSVKSGRDTADEFLGMSQVPTSVFCFNDEMAMGVCQRFKEAGISVPEYISVAGFDDINFASLHSPSLTTIRQPAEEIGKAAALQLYNILRGIPPSERHIVFPFDLITRDSTGPARKS